MRQVKDLKSTSQEKIYKFIKSRLSDYGFEQEYHEIPDFDLDTKIAEPLSKPTPGNFVSYAIECDDADLLEDLCKNGASVNASDDFLGGLKPLQYAADLGRADLVKILLKHGASADKVKVRYSIDPCNYPRTFIWSFFEKAQGRTVNYGEVAASLGKSKTR